ncbi:MAG: hydroxymethylbilane synthase [Hyphomonadaceae bacterium]|nr:hydroxymethylbilane synthase [Hyphomonadaceae bacterium]
MRVGTRKSTMALAQTDMIVRALNQRFPGLGAAAELFDTSGDRDQHSKLGVHGGKGGAFVAEIRRAILSGSIEAAMHSLKDMPGNEETPGLIVGAYLEREDARDSMALRPGLTYEAIRDSQGASIKIGTNSVRRAAYARQLFPKAEIIHFRGAADTRIQKLDTGIKQTMPDGVTEVGPADALIMAKAGLERIGLTNRVAHTFSLKEMLPAVSQGIIAVECSERDWQTRERLAAIDSEDSRMRAYAEREVLWVLNGHCNSPIAGHAHRDHDEMYLTAAVMNADGTRVVSATQSGPVDKPRELGRSVAFELLDKGAAQIITATRE